jgi:phage I-like protein
LAKTRARHGGVVNKQHITASVLIDAGALPSRITLFPKGASFTARDGRGWKLSDMAGVVAAFLANQASLPIDINHSSDLLAPKGGESPAAGWIEAIDIEDGVLVADVTWTPKGETALTSREYRYFSPSFFVDSATGEILSVSGGALVNHPALFLPALAGREAHQENIMSKELAQALGLAENATAAELVLAGAKLKADLAAAQAAAASPPIDKFVPIETFASVKARAEAAEAELAAAKKAEAEKVIADLVDGAVRAGKIPPANKDFYLASCRAEGGVEAFKKLVETIAPITGKIVLPKSGESGAGLTETQKQIARAGGHKEEEYAAVLAGIQS